MKKILNFWLLAALVFGLGMSVTSCKDDDKDDGKTEEQKQEEAQEKASKFWDVMAQLVSVDDVTDDYEGKTFEPTIGIADSSDPLTRIVATNDMKTAARRFADLVGAKGIDENTPTYTWSDPDIGTMTYTRGGTAAEWATVDVSIKAVPHLQKIIYRVGGEGDNGSFEGRAYYRFGDVVSRQVTVTYNQKKNNDQRGTITEYWICVRPAFGPEGKEDSHWVCVNTVSDKNYKYYKASTGTEYWLPTSLGTDKENMQNFAELLYAICRPETWFNNIVNFHEDGTLWGYDGVPFFSDFKAKNLKYHNQYFWQNVQDAWDAKQVAEKALNLNGGLGALMDKISRDGVHLLYKGYSWWFTTSWNCQLWEAVYTNGTKNEEKNLHHAVYNEEVERNMKDLRFDVRTMGQTTENYLGFFNNDGKYRWVIRHATGKELASNGKFDVKQPIQGVTEVYRYYSQYPAEWTRPTEDEKPEITQANRDIVFQNRGYYEVADVVIDNQKNKWFCVLPSGYKQKDWVDDYAYFVSYDEKAVGTELQHVPSSKNLVMQMTFCMECAYHNAISSPNNSWQTRLQLVKDYAGVTFNEIFGLRDSTVTHKGNKDPSLERNSFISGIYRENGQLYVLRTVGDYTRDQVNGGREWSWDFWTRYTKTTPSERKMLLSDLADQNIINQYNDDVWVARKWYNAVTEKQVSTNTGPRTQPEAVTPLSHFIYRQGTGPWLGQGVANMYREPLYAFAVKRVKDQGKCNTVFEDGTQFQIVSQVMDYLEPERDDDFSNALETIANTYLGYINQTIRCDGVPYDFGMKNKP